MSEAVEERNNAGKKSHKKLIIILVILTTIVVLFLLFGVSYIKRHFIEKEVDVSAALDIKAVDLDSVKC